MRKAYFIGVLPKTAGLQTIAAFDDSYRARTDQIQSPAAVPQELDL